MREERSPNARIVGLVFLLYFVVGGVGSLLSKGLVHSDAAATANSLLTHESLYRAGLAFDLVANVIYIALTALLYRLFAGVSPSLASMAAFSSLTGCAIQIFGELLRLAPLIILQNPALQRAFSPGQLQAAALLSLELYRQVFSISFVLFGFFMLVLGCLIYKSGFLPKFLGIWMMAGGVGAMMFLWPPLARSLWYVILALDAAEGALMLWLIIKGVDRSPA